MFYLIKQYIKYALSSKRVSEKNSVYLNEFKDEVLDKPIHLKNLDKINKLRSFHLNNNFQVKQEDYGAGSKTFDQNKKINTSDLARNVSVKKKYGNILYNLVNFLNIETVLELGTSLGISSAYMSSAQVISIEGNSELSDYTAKTLKDFHFKNVKVIKAQFDDVFEDLLKNNTFDLVFVDGNHSQEATLRYFEILLKYKKNKTVVIFDDINWSFGMNNAWTIIKAHKDVKLSIDLFTFGIVFFDERFKEKENTVIWH